MARPVPPQQPRLGREREEPGRGPGPGPRWDPDDPDHRGTDPHETMSGDTVPDGIGEGTGDPVRVRVNDGTKVSRVDTGSLEETPAPGGRFSTWRRRRRAQREAGAAEPSENAGERTVVAFPRSEASRRRRGRWLALLTVLVVALLFVGLVFFSPLFATRTINVEGARLTNPERVEDALEGFKGVPLTRVSKDGVRAAVGDVPQVRSVDVVLQPPHTITVRLHERVGVAAVRDGEHWVLVDSQGKQLATSGPQDRPDVPVIDGGRQVLATEQFATVADVLAELPAEVLSRLDSASASSGASVELSFRDGRKAVWGDASDSELKARVLAALATGEATSSAREYDVSAPLHPVVK